MPSSAKMSKVPAAKRSAAATYGAASTRAPASIHAVGVNARSGSGTSQGTRPQRSARIAAACNSRCAISAADMQRTRLSYQARAVMASRSSRVLAVPDLEVEERPEELLVVLSAVDMLLHRLLEGLRLVVPARARVGAQQVLAQVLLERTAEPLVHRHAEAHLRTLEDRLGNEAAPRAPQDPLGLEPVHAAAVGKRRDVAGELVVEERDARLDRGGHGHAVAALAQVVRKPARLVPVEDPAQR